jgi:hypothetical protein
MNTTIKTIIGLFLLLIDMLCIFLWGYWYGCKVTRRSFFSFKRKLKQELPKHET